MTRSQLPDSMRPYRVDAKTRCWIPSAKPSRDGYVRWDIGRRGAKKHWLAHRWSWFIHTGTLPHELDHLCRNKRCVSPSHLDPVTHRTNMRRGKAIVLTTKSVRRIRVAYANRRDSAPHLAEQFGVSVSTVFNLLSYKAWGDTDADLRSAIASRMTGKLSDADRAIIKREYRTGARRGDPHSAQDLAARFRICAGYISQIATGAYSAARKTTRRHGGWGKS